VSILNVVQDRDLYRRVRREVDEIRQGKLLMQTSKLDISSNALLSSIFAETLRIHSTSLLPITPTGGQLFLGKWSMPKGSYGMICAGVCHRNTQVWNTKDGLHPLDSFWADRFIVDPSDPMSGPIKPEVREELQVKLVRSNKPYYSIEGLEGTWVPFGGK
jgi:hypothetical protein